MGEMGGVDGTFLSKFMYIFFQALNKGIADICGVLLIRSLY